MQSDHFDLREWCREQVRLSGMRQKEIAQYSGLSQKTISQMMHHDTGTIDSWQRILNALPHVNRYELPSTVQSVLRLCDYWDNMTHGESPTTSTIRTVIRKGLKL